MIKIDLSNPFYGKHDGNVNISGESWQLNGMIIGDITVRDSGHFICNGMVIGNVDVDDISSAVINGMVIGYVSGTGDIQIFGMTKNIS